MEALKANELRLGNFVLYKNEVLAVKSISNSVVSLEGKDYWVLIKDCEPIPLSENWMIMAGFEKIKGLFSIYLSELERSEIERKKIDIYFGSERIAAELCRSGICFSMVTCNYVHQLQNLYFALTGTELEFKPE